ncbi:MAG: DoxX family membrane protein [Ilumatobacteraceae bacterium]|nr:DoxX family membrane protein [Ilumatobacteraceae bacterium]
MNTTFTPKKFDLLAFVIGMFLLIAGITHFANPDFFNDIVPPWLPPSEAFWTYISGVAEIIVGAMLLRPATRRLGAYAAAGLFIAVYPANLYMAWDWRDHPASDQLISYGRLPFQFLFIWLALRIAQRKDS